MKGMQAVEMVLLLLVGIASIGILFVSINRISTKSLSASESAMIYPEVAPQILKLYCNETYGDVYLDVEGSLSGTLWYRLKHLNGTLVTDNSTTVNISNYGSFNFSATMVDGDSYLLKLYTPKWETSETCLSDP